MSKNTTSCCTLSVITIFTAIRVSFSLCEIIYGFTSKDTATCKAVKPSPWLIVSGFFGLLETLYVLRAVCTYDELKDTACRMLGVEQYPMLKRICAFELLWLGWGIGVLCSCYDAGSFALHVMLATSVISKCCVVFLVIFALSG
jgi:hypothetical protein